MVVSGTNGGAFCLDFGAVVLSGLVGTITVEYTIGHYVNGDSGRYNEYTLVETYTPNANGEVHIKDLGQLAKAYFDRIPFELDASSHVLLRHAATVLISMEVSDADGNSLGSASQRFYYANCRTNISDAHQYRGFLTRYRRTKVRADQAVSLGYLSNGQSLYVGINYTQNGTVQWLEMQLQAADSPATGELIVYNLNVDTIKARLATQLGASATLNEVVNYYIVYLKSGTEILDAVQFDVETRHRHALTHFAYYNCFGVPDTLFFTGQDERKTEMSATYAKIAHNYRKIQTDYTINHDINTGYITEVQRDCVEDLVMSDKVWLYDINGLGDMITITSVDFNESVPRTEPINVALTYRVSTEYQRRCDRDPSIDYRIFDHTFGVEFE